MKFIRIKYYYFKYILRPSRTLKLSLSYLYGRIILFLALKGIKIPGLDKIKNKLPKAALDIFERKVLIYEIKGERFSFRKGPLWLRKTFEKIIFIFEKNKFWFFTVLKTLIAVVVIIIPIALFIVLRGMLPVPERVKYTRVSTTLPAKSFLRTDWLYTEGPFRKKEPNEVLNYNVIDPKHARGVTITPVLEPDAPNGLYHFGIGYYPSKLNLMRGFLVGESTHLTVNRQKNIVMEVEKGNRLRIQYYLFPSQDSKEHQCKIELKDENNNTLVSTQKTTLNKNSLDTERGLTRSLHGLFTPGIFPESSNMSEFILNSKSLPEKIIATVTAVEPMLDDAHLHKEQDNKIAVHDVTNDNCIFALGDFSFERVVVNPPKRRGVIFILVDTLRADTAYDKAIMPNLNQFADDNGVQFLEHRAQANMTVPSVASLMTSRFAREVGPIAFTYAAGTNLRKNFYATQTPLLPTSMQNLGYRVGGIGWLSLFSEAMEGGVDFGFHNAIVSENSAYEARHITELMGSWLENYGEAPFFLYLHYNTMHGPYKPPFAAINLSKFLSKPFGLNQKKQLYDALGRFWDDEFLNIIQKLKDLGIYNDVDIIVTADHGAQFYNQPWNNLAGVEQGVTGGYADKGHTLLDEEVRVPLIMHVANSQNLYGTKVSIPTAHADLFPTIYDLAGGTTPDLRWRGIDLTQALFLQNKTFASLLQKRDTIYFDAHRYAGILYWGGQFQRSPRKYIRQFDPDNAKLYLTHNPWSVDIRWYQPEIFTTVDLINHTENWVPTLKGDELKNVRKAYFMQTPSDKVLRIIPKYSGQFSALVTIKYDQNTKKPEVILSPSGIHLEKQDNSNVMQFKFDGDVKTNEAIWINMSSSKLEKIFFEKSITPLICQNGNFINSENIPSLFENNVCPFFSPPEGIIEQNYLLSEKPVVIQKSLSSEQVQQIEGSGAGEALQKALREWGYAK
ncbi:MAG: sulfatase [Bdellovibrionota bacterium]